VFALLAPSLIRRGSRTAARHAEGPGRSISLLIFALSAVILLSMSGVFHLLQPRGIPRAVFQRLDHAGIFFLIAGTFTPIHVIMFRGLWRWGILALVWTVALLGVTLKSIYFNSIPEALGIGLYLGMGWIGLASFLGLIRRVPMRTSMPLILGGIAYTCGALIDGLAPRDLIPGVVRAHELFHILVIGGLALHWRFIWVVAGHDPVESVGHSNASTSTERHARHAPAPRDTKAA